MEKSRGRRMATVVLVFGAVVFGMVLAGGLSWTPSGFGAQDDRGAVGGGPVEIPPGLDRGVGFADLAESVAPAVVTIRSVHFEAGPGAGARRGPEEVDPFFEFFFGPRRRPGEPEQEAPREFRSEAGGSGFLISEDGLIVTNNHVVEGANQLMVGLDDGREFEATVRGIDPATDLALVQIDAGRALPHLRLGSSDSLRVGDWVMVIGNPLRLGRTVTVGVVSAKGRAIGITDISFENFIQTDAAINFGNSGGPMVNLRGEVVGIATAINWGAENVGFAVPVSTLSSVLPQLEKEGRVRRGYLGVNIENIDFRTQEAFGLESTDGALVQQVVAGTPAADAGLEHGDVILAVDGMGITTTRDLINYVSAKPPGAKVRLDVLRQGKRIERTVTLGERPSQGEESSGGEEPESSGIEWLGIRYQELTPGLKESHGIPADVNGVWVRSISPRSPLNDENVRPGDVITEVNGRKIASAAELEEAVGSAPSGSYVRLYVERFDPRSGRSIQFFAFARVP
ncbi:MAG TPA: Do family serine endopeptidase [Thermoanaerobaculia bacterium]|nr:Do family serine endopeptidase [Thermoanaerobaculia bacterium]